MNAHQRRKARRAVARARAATRARLLDPEVAVVRLITNAELWESLQAARRALLDRYAGALALPTGRYL